MLEENDKQQSSFRDSIATIDDDGKRNWIYPKKPKGRYFKLRVWVSSVLLILLFSGPYLRVFGQPLLLLNFIERKFIILGVIFWPQDFHLFFLAMIIFVVFIILFTVTLGRIWCGWACPQTIFMEMVFRRIEYFIEGGSGEQKRLKNMPWNWEKIWKRGLKFILFFTISFAIANTFLAYIIGSDELINIITDNPKNHVSGLSSILIFTMIFYFVFAWFREQVCIVVCPYGRLQGVMQDSNTIMIAYNYLRGENKSKVRKGEDRNKSQKGDCIDCHQCVAVCPTGIDIRNGTQLECINCTACIDACDEIMEKVGFEKGLISYNSENGIIKNRKNLLTTKAKSYIAVLALLFSLLIFLLTSRTDVETVLLRAPGQLYQIEKEYISNLYTYEVINKTSKKQSIEFRLESHEGKIYPVGIPQIEVKEQNFIKGSVFIKLKRSDLESTKTEVEIGIYSHGIKIDEISTNFSGPNESKNKKR